MPCLCAEGSRRRTLKPEESSLVWGVMVWVMGIFLDTG